MNSRLLSLILSLALVLTVFTSIYLYFQSQRPQTTAAQTHQLQIGSKTITVEIADSLEEHKQGLSGRRELAENTGMYFVLEKEAVQTFWMNGMLFSIDIIWVKDGKIVGVEKNAPLPTGGEVPLFTSPEPIAAVLEVPAGFFDKNNLQLQDPVKLIN